MHLLSLISFPLGYCRVDQRFVLDLSDFLLVEILLCVLIIILVKGIFDLKLSKLEFAMAKTNEATIYLEELVNLETSQRKECKYFNKMLLSPTKSPSKMTSKPDLVNMSELCKIYSTKTEFSKESSSRTIVKIEEPDDKSNKTITKVTECSGQKPLNEHVQSSTSIRSQKSTKKSDRRSRLPVPPKPKTPVDPPEAGDSTKMNASHSAPTQDVEESWKTNAVSTDISASADASPFISSEPHPSDTSYTLNLSTSNLNQPIPFSNPYSSPLGNSENRFVEVPSQKASNASKILKPQSLTLSNTNRDKCPSKAIRGPSKHADLEKSSRTSFSRGSSS